MFKEALLSQSQGLLNVLEWGSGGSTVYFTRFLREQGIDYSWTSLEYNADWYQRVQKLVENDSSTHLKLFDVGNHSLRQRHTDMEEYIKYPATLGKHFDLIFVDGRKRRRCLLEARRLISKDGIVFLHDAHRRHYHSALKEYPTSRFVTPFFWYGTMKKPKQSQKIKNKLMNVTNKLIYLMIFAPFYAVKRTVRSYLYGIPK